MRPLLWPQLVSASELVFVRGDERRTYTPSGDGRHDAYGDGAGGGFGNGDWISVAMAGDGDGYGDGNGDGDGMTLT